MALDDNFEVNISGSYFNPLEEAYQDLVDKYRSQNKLSLLGLNAFIDQTVLIKLN